MYRNIIQEYRNNEEKKIICITIFKKKNQCNNFVFISSMSKQNDNSYALKNETKMDTEDLNKKYQ